MSIKLATPREAKEILDSDAEALYVDVRTEPEFAAGHPEGSVNVPVFVRSTAGSLQQNPEFVDVVQQLAALDRPILCGCQAGRRSQAAAELLVRAGYTNITNVLGGYGGGQDPRDGSLVPGWSQSGLPVSTNVADEVSYAGLRRSAGLG